MRQLSIYRDVQEEDTIMIEELWSSQEDLERHLCSSECRGSPGVETGKGSTGDKVQHNLMFKRF